MGGSGRSSRRQDGNKPCNSIKDRLIINRVAAVNNAHVPRQTKIGLDKTVSVPLLSKHRNDTHIYTRALIKNKNLSLNFSTDFIYKTFLFNTIYFISFLYFIFRSSNVRAKFIKNKY